eukprot:5728349-Amphidinium_carterae.1
MQTLQTKVSFGKWEYRNTVAKAHSSCQMDRSFSAWSSSQHGQVEGLRDHQGRTKEPHKTAFRAMIGGLLWAARTGVPQVYGDCSLPAERVSTLTHAARLALSKTLMRARETVAPIAYLAQPPADV